MEQGPVVTERQTLIPESLQTRGIGDQHKYSLYLENDALIHRPSDISPHTSCKLLRNSVRTNSFSDPGDLDTCGSNPRINLCFPTPPDLRSKKITPILYDRDFENEIPADTYKSKRNTVSSDESELFADHNSLDKPDDGNSASQLSASPDFWKRVSSQLVYIDNSSFGGSCRSGSFNSGTSYSRGRSAERGLEERSVKWRKGKSVDRDTKSIDSALILDRDKGVSWKLSIEHLEDEDGLSPLKKKEIPLERQFSVDVDDQVEDSDKFPSKDDLGEKRSHYVPKKTIFDKIRHLLKIARETEKKEVRLPDDRTSNTNVSNTTAEVNQTCIDIENTEEELRRIRSETSNPIIHSVLYNNKAKKSNSDQNDEEFSEALGLQNENDTVPKLSSERNDCKKSHSKAHKPIRRYYSLDNSVIAGEGPQNIRLSPERHKCQVVVPLQEHYYLQDEQKLHRQHPPLRNTDDLERRRSLFPSQSIYYMEKDLRYYFQHPWLRLLVAYFVIFCNFLLFAEDPLSHSHTESNINVVGNVFSFVATKYPTEWYWKLVKVISWVVAVLCGMLVGKVLIHGMVCKRMFRLKMFRDEQGSWMCMFLTVIVSTYMFSYVYNLLLLIAHPQHLRWQITSAMGVTNESMMKAAATCTWLGDLVTALMVTDMMLQDRLYPHWGTKFRRLYNLSNIPRILIFWVGSIVVSVVVIFLIVSDYISWSNLNKGFVETTELSRALLASFILVMDLLIVMQDWDFPHFTSTVDVNLPGFSTHTLHWKWAKLSFTGKWFNYGIIFMVMMLDLNMWKNQLFYQPQDYGQYTDPYGKVYILEDPLILSTGNKSLWTWSARSWVHPETGKMPRDGDPFMYSRWMGYSTALKCTAFIPNILGMIMFFTLVTLYGRFPPNQDGTYGGRLKKRTRSSWHRERRSICDHNDDDESIESHRQSRCTSRACQLRRCRSTHPDFAGTRYSNPNLLNEYRVENSDAENMNSDTDETNVKENRSDGSLSVDHYHNKLKRKRSLAYKDIRVFGDTPIDMENTDEQELQRQFTEILSEKDRKYSQCERLSQSSDENSESESNFSTKEKTFRERMSANWKRKYSRKLNFSFAKREFPDISTAEYADNLRKLDMKKEHGRNHHINFKETDKQKNLPKIRERRVSESGSKLKKYPKTHKRVSSAETRLIAPVKVRIEGMRFFRRRQDNTQSSEISFDENAKVAHDSKVKQLIESDLDRYSEEGVEMVAKSTSDKSPESEDVSASEGTL